MLIEIIIFAQYFEVTTILFFSPYIIHRKIRWADPGGAAIPGQPETEVEQAPGAP